MVQTGLDRISENIPANIIGKPVAVLCHAPSINNRFEHIIDILAESKEVNLVAIFGPQHGLFGQTQDNMIEWEGIHHPVYNIPVYSLYGSNRKPTMEMLKGIEVFIVDLQDVGARPYTYIWTLKNVMEACSDAGIPLVVLDRPNPISHLGTEGPVLKREYFTFVGGAEIPLSHNMTIGEIALWLQVYEGIDCQLSVEWMTAWERGMSFKDTYLPWVLPSPNMPGLQTAEVYPGMVLTEALNMSEARGTTIPFELFGAPGLNTRDLLMYLNSLPINSCAFREHDFIPTFNKYANEYCKGLQIHISNLKTFEPVYTAICLYDAIMETNPGYLEFNNPPYEYEYKLMPFDILIGDNVTRELLIKRSFDIHEKERWKSEVEDFSKKLDRISYY